MGIVLNALLRPKGEIPYCVLRGMQDTDHAGPGRPDKQSGFHFMSHRRVPGWKGQEMIYIFQV